MENLIFAVLALIGKKLLTISTKFCFKKFEDKNFQKESEFSQIFFEFCFKDT